MITVKSGEIGTPKGENKVKALHKISAVLGESIMSFRVYLEENERAVPVLKKSKYRANEWNVYNSKTKKDTDWFIKKVSNKEWVLVDPNEEYPQTFNSLARCKQELTSYAAAFNPED